MKQANKIILEALELKLEAEEDIEFIEALYELKIVGEHNNWEPSEETVERLEKVLAEEDSYPKTESECLERIEKVCQEAEQTYDNENFYEDDVDTFMGEASMARDVLEIIDQYKYAEKVNRIKNSRKVISVNDKTSRLEI